MKLKSFLHTLTTGFVLSMLMCLNPAAAQDSVGKVLMIQGKVLAYSESGDQRVLKANATIYEGDTIETIGEGSVVVTLADGTQWDIFDTSKLSILEYVFTPEGSSRDSAIFKFHEGQAIYTSGMLGKRGAEVAIQMDDQTVYPQGTSISFFDRQEVKVVTIREGNGRIVTNTKQEVKVKTNQWVITEDNGTPVVVSSQDQAITVIQRIFTRTMTKRTASGKEISTAKQMVDTIVKVGNRIVSKVRTTDREIIKTDADGTTTTITTSSGGSGNLPGLIESEPGSGTFIVVTTVDGIAPGTLVTIDTSGGTTTLVPVSPN